ncbi:MAG: hypothetical protein F9K31_14155 [Dokdonella sp.]|nr:MAG: hypothetical protein F9K31_14155 [Dokdonella sp.]
MKTTRHLVVAGAPPADSAAIASFLRVLHAEFDHEWTVAGDGDEIHLVVADLSEFGGRCARIRALDEGRHLIVIADPGTDVLDSELVLYRPLVAKAVVGMFNHVGATTPPAPRRLTDFSVHERQIEKLARPVVQPRRDEANPARANFLDIQYERPCTRLEPLLKRGALLIKRGGLAPLLVDPVTEQFHSSARMSELEPYFLDPLKGNEYQRVGGAQLAALQREHEGRPLIRLLWLSAFLRSNGWLARHLDPSGYYRLTQWLPLDNDYRKQHRIAMTLMREAQLHVIAKSAKAYMADVFDVVNAYDALGLIEVHRQPSAARGEAAQRSRKAKLLATTLFTR